MARPLKTVILNPAPGASITADILTGTAPAFVYLHGLSSGRGGEKSDALLRRAQRRGRAFARFDFRAHGDSPGHREELTLSDLIEDSTTVLQRMGPSVLVGSSLGGLVAAWVASRHPDLVQGLTLLSPAFGFLPAMAKEESSGLITDSTGSELQFSRRTVEDARQYDESDLPGRLPMPILIVHGDLDDAVPYQLSQRFHDAVPHDRKHFWLVRGGDHRLNLPIEDIYDRMDELMG